MKKILQILFFAFLGAAALHTAQAQTYDPLAVQRINDLIAKNGLEATPNAPETWEFATWNDETPKQIISISLNGDQLRGDVSFMGLTTLQRIVLFCNMNINKLDMTNCTQLTYLNCSGDAKHAGNVGIEELYLTNCSQLQKLICDNNELTKLDLTSCLQLQYLNCHYNRITKLDVTNCTQLQYLNCVNNHLTELDLTGLDNLKEYNGGWQRPKLTLYDNGTGEYTCTISLNNPTFDNDAISYSEGILKSNDKNVPYTVFSVQTTKFGYELSGLMSFTYSLGINPQDKMEVHVFPNPTNGELTIENGELRITKVEVFDIYGRKQNAECKIQNAHEIIINMLNLSEGAYFVKISSSAGVVVKKVVKH